MFKPISVYIILNVIYVVKLTIGISCPLTKEKFVLGDSEYVCCPEKRDLIYIIIQEHIRDQSLCPLNLRLLPL